MKPYEYSGLKATTWDLFRGDPSARPDRQFFLEVIERCGEPVLDVGCGTGQLLLAYRSQGIDIDGIDNSPEMLDICRRKAQAQGVSVTLFRQDMREMVPSRLYHTVLVPSGTFQLITDQQEAQLVMSRLHGTLAGGGTLVIVFIVLGRKAPADGAAQAEWTLSGQEVDPADGLLYRLWSRQRFDCGEQLEHLENRFEVIRNGEIIRSEEHVTSPVTRWYSQAQALRLFRITGFEDVVATSGFTNEPANLDDEVFCVRGTRPTSEAAET